MERETKHKAKRERAIECVQDLKIFTNWWKHKGYIYMLRDERSSAMHNFLIEDGPLAGKYFEPMRELLLYIVGGGPDLLETWSQAQMEKYESRILAILKSKKIQRTELEKYAKSLLSQQYKIHLMPKPQYVCDLIMFLLSNLPKNVLIKVKSGYETVDDLYNKKQQQHMPVVVLYSVGKQNTENLVKYLTYRLGNLAGIGVDPEYNEKVTSLIYYAGGDRDVKNLAKRSKNPKVKNLFTRDYKFYSK